MKKLVLIGGSGFIGTRLIDLIGSQNCFNIDKAPSARFNDITSLFDIRNKDLKNVIIPTADTVVLLAAEHRDDVTPVNLYYDVNVNGTKNVIEAIEEMGIRNIIFTSSAAVYGLQKNNPDENSTPEPSSPYGKSKLEAEKILIKWQKKDPQNHSLTIIRSAAVFGENNRGNVYNLLRQIASGKFLMVGKGNNRKSMAYVGNNAAFIHYCIKTSEPGYRIINYADQPDLTMNELVIQVEKSLNKKLPAVRFPYWLGRIGGLSFDVVSSLTGIKFRITSERIKKFCVPTQLNAALVHNSDFVPPFTLDEGLDRTVHFEFGDGSPDEGDQYSLPSALADGR